VHACPTRWPLLRVEVAERSMLPALRPGDWLLAVRTRRVRPGQVVLAWHPARADFLLVKRAVRRVTSRTTRRRAPWTATISARCRRN